MNIQEQVQRLVDLEAIRDLPRRYADCIWRKDAEGAAALFTEDCIMDIGFAEPLRSRAAIAASYVQAFSRNSLQPFVHNHLIDLAGDTATGIVYLDLRASVNNESQIGAGYYADVYVRSGKGWLFQSRKLTMHYLVPINAGWSQPGQPE